MVQVVQSFDYPCLRHPTLGSTESAYRDNISTSTIDMGIGYYFENGLLSRAG